MSRENYEATRGLREGELSQTETECDSLFGDRHESATGEEQEAQTAPREPSAFYIPAHDSALIDYGEERLDKVRSGPDTAPIQ